jgi:DNA-binding HxlR family transcriptional regulator
MTSTPSDVSAAPADTANRCGQGVLKLVADYWVLRIVEEVSLSADGARFSALQRALGGASPATLANRLRMLTGEGLLSREVGETPQSVVYRLTDRGRRLLPVLRSIQEFAANA